MTALFITILNMSITASVVALAVMLSRIPLRKAPKIFSYALWGVVLFRLVFPFGIESMFSLMPVSRAAIPHSIVYSPNPAIQTGVQFFDMPINTAINNALPPVAIENSVNPIHIILEIAGYVWFIGFLALMVYAAIGYISLKRRVRFATLVRDNLFESDKIVTPFVLGFIRPKIYLPVRLGPSQYDYILKHEQTHIKRRDYIIKPLAYAVFALHWFNPLMWISYSLMSKDMVNPIAFGGNNINERVINVISFKKSAKWVSVVSLVAVAVFFIWFTFNRVELVTVEAPNIPHIQDESALDEINGWAEWLEWYNSLSQEQQAYISVSPPPNQITSVEELQVAFIIMEALGKEMEQLGLEMAAARISELESIGFQMSAVGEEMAAWGTAIENFANSHPVSHQEAMEIARNYLGIHSSRNFTSRSFDIQDGRTVWRFTFSGHSQISVDANTGEIVHS